MISITELTKNYGDTKAVDNISFDIPKGQILGLLGPNGAGKTTTLRILTGYLKSTHGTITVKGFDVGKNPLEVKKLIGYLPESAPLYADMLVFDYLMYIAEIREIPNEKRVNRIRELAGSCGIREVMHKTINELSKGYKQRVGLAQALMTDPEILVLDEPTSGLDPNQIAEIRSIIKEIGREKTIIFSTHILSEAEATCDRVVIINKGKVSADGSTEMLKDTHAGDNKIRVVLKEGNLDDVKSLFSGNKNITSVSGEKKENGLEVSFTCKGDLREDVYLEIKKRDWIILEFIQERKSLEKIFRELTKE